MPRKQKKKNIIHGEHALNVVATGLFPRASYASEVDKLKDQEYVFQRRAAGAIVSGPGLYGDVELLSYARVESIRIGNFKLTRHSSIKGKITIAALSKKGDLVEAGQFSEKKLAQVIGQFYAENF